MHAIYIVVRTSIRLDTGIMDKRQDTNFEGFGCFSIRCQWNLEQQCVDVKVDGYCELVLHDRQITDEKVLLFPCANDHFRLLDLVDLDYSTMGPDQSKMYVNLGV